MSPPPPPYRVVLLDDEYPALQVLRTFLERLAHPRLHLAAAFQDPQQAQTYLHEQPVHLLFLDVHMPWLRGTTLLRSLANPPAVIFTTAYESFALEAFELNAIDYLTKPVGYERFEQAVTKALRYLQPPPPDTAAAAGEVLVVRSGGRTLRLPVHEVLAVEGWQEYVRLHTRTQGVVVVYERLKNLAAQLPADAFLRVHKSYLVQAQAVVSLDRQGGNYRLRLSNQMQVPVSRTYREALLGRLFS